MSYLVTYYPNKDVIRCLRKYKKAMNKFINDSKSSSDSDNEAQVAFEELIGKLSDEVALERYTSVYDSNSITELSDTLKYEDFLNEEINIVSQTLQGTTGRSEVIVYNSLNFINNSNREDDSRVNDIINFITVSHHSNMAKIRASRRTMVAEKDRAKRRIRASVEYIVCGTAILVVNNTLLVGPLQIPSSTLGAGAILRGVADIRGV